MVESQLHKDLKHAAGRLLSHNCDCSYESTLSPWGGSGSLRADVYFNKNGRRYYIECETAPNIKRLQRKGFRRNHVQGRNMYILFIPNTVYHSLNWDQLKGYFDQVIAYNLETQQITDKLDLRTLGWLRYTILDCYIPIITSRQARDLRYLVFRKKGVIKHKLRTLIQCTAGTIYLRIGFSAQKTIAQIASIISNHSLIHSRCNKGSNFMCDRLTDNSIATVPYKHTLFIRKVNHLLTRFNVMPQSFLRVRPPLNMGYRGKINITKT